MLGDVAKNSFDLVLTLVEFQSAIKSDRCLSSFGLDVRRIIGADRPSGGLGLLWIAPSFLVLAAIIAPFQRTRQAATLEGL